MGIIALIEVLQHERGVTVNQRVLLGSVPKDRLFFRGDGDTVTLSSFW